MDPCESDEAPPTAKCMKFEITLSDRDHNFNTAKSSDVCADFLRCAQN